MKKNKTYLTILILCLIGVLNSLGVLLNAISVNVLNSRLKALETAENGVKKEITINDDESFVIKYVIVDKEGTPTYYDIWTDKDGNVDVVVNGE